MRIAYLSLDPGIPVGGESGAAVHVESVTSALARAGHEVTILAARGAEGGRSTCRILPVALPTSSRRDVKAVGALVRRLTPDYRYDRDLRALLLNAIMAEPLASELALLGADVVLERLSLFGLAGLDAARIQGIPHAIEMNAPLAAEAARFRGLTAEPLARAVEAEVLRGTDFVFAVSQRLGAYCQSLGVHPDRVLTVSNGADLAAFAPGVGSGKRRLELGWIDGEVVVGFVGGLRPWHGGVDLAAAFIRLAASHPKARLLVVGDGPERGSMEALLNDGAVGDRTMFLGAVPHDAVPSYVAAMDIAVAPYRPADDFYFSPLKLYEYMAAGKPIVASALGQIAEVIADRVNGALVDPSDSCALTAVLAELVADDGMRKRLGERARESVSRHDWSQKAVEIQVELQELVDRARSPGVAVS